MAYCANCGLEMGAGARFCTHCGRPLDEGSSAAPAPVRPLEYSIQGDNLQVARIQLRPGQEIYAEAGKMVYKTANVRWETRMSGGSIGDKILGALRRTVMGESIFLTYFRCDGEGEVGFAGNYPGKITVFDLEPGRSLFDLGGLLMDLRELLDCPVDVVTEAGLRPRIRSRVLHDARPL